MAEKSTYEVTHEITRVKVQEVKAHSAKQAEGKAEQNIDEEDHRIEFVSSMKQYRGQ